MSRKSKGHTGLGARPALQGQEGMPTRRHPRALRRELMENIRRVEAALELLGSPLDWFDALQSYRARRLPMSAATMALRFGVTGGPPQKAFPYLRDLDLSFQRIHNYDPAEYRTPGSISDSQRVIAALNRNRTGTRKQKLVEIGAWLQHQRYAESADKGKIVEDAMKAHDCGETDIRDAARLAGLTRTYRKTTK